MKPGKSAIEVGDFENLLPTLNLVTDEHGDHVQGRR
jgi:hypothetical protein